MLFTYTDGIPEAQNAKGEFFGDDRLIEILSNGYSSASEAVKQVETAVKTHNGKSDPFDDLTMLAVKRN